jgi:hypothetical protein
LPFGQIDTEKTVSKWCFGQFARLICQLSLTDYPNKFNVGPVLCPTRTGPAKAVSAHSAQKRKEPIL